MQGASEPSGRRTKASPLHRAGRHATGGTLSLNGVQLPTTLFRRLANVGHARPAKASPDPVLHMAEELPFLDTSRTVAPTLLTTNAPSSYIPTTARGRVEDEFDRTLGSFSCPG